MPSLPWPPVRPERLLAVFDSLVGELREAVGVVDDRTALGDRQGQYRLDLVADRVVTARLHGAGLRVLSEESGLTGSGPVTVVVDPVDGSTNASLDLPWYATSLCAVDHQGPLCALVENLATGERFEAVRGAGATCDGRGLAVTSARGLSESIIGLSGWPATSGRARQYRVLGAAALDLCSVAAGRLDGYVDCDGAHGVWDYLGAWLVCREAGAVMGERQGRDLVVLDPQARRGPVAAASPGLLAELLAWQREADPA
jgi:myo-inositol-1(or 4)-monophosphatase